MGENIPAPLELLYQQELKWWEGGGRNDKNLCKFNEGQNGHLSKEGKGNHVKALNE